jgi:hypothetical protein
MYISIIVILAAFTWLLIETDYMRVRLVGNQTGQFTIIWYPTFYSIRGYVDDFLILIGFMFPVIIMIFMNFVFFSAYITDNKSILICINSANEANLEAILIPFMTILALIGVYKILMKFYRGKECPH